METSQRGKDSWRLGWARERVPQICRGTDIIIGIDEAGRGPVLGSLVYCAAFWPVSENDSISCMGFDDSKQLKDGEREKFLKAILSHPSIGYIVREITAQEISEQMLQAYPKSLNAISYDAVIEILEKIRDVSPDPPHVQHVYVDTVGDPDFYRSKLIEAMGTSFAENITVEKKADATYKVVGAASIIAKQSRDALLETYQYQHGLSLDKNFGSGYPSDEKCVQWMERSVHNVFGYPTDVMRFSWSTCRQMLKDREAIVVEWPCDKEKSMGRDITTFFAASCGNNSKKRRRTDYFQARKMNHVTASNFLE